MSGSVSVSAGSGLLLDGDPDGAVVVGVGRFPVHAVVPLHGGVSAEFVIGVAGQPFGEDPGIHALERPGVGADAVEHSPIVARELVDHHSLGDRASGVLAGDQIAEPVRAEVVDADAVFADAVVHERLLVGVGRLVAGIDVVGVLRADLIPEPGDFRVCGLVVEFFLETDDLEREHRNDLVVHLGASLYR